jgi:hypothetical protein
MAKLFDSPLHRIDCRTRERLGDVPYSASNQSLGCLWISVAKLSNPSCDFWEKIACLKFEIVFV